MNQRILIVDDDPNILQGFKRQLRKRFQIITAIGGKEGLEVLAKDGPFAVVVSDMQMPEMNGIQFLNKVRQRAPHSVRMMLTGNADQKTAMDAVNDGHIFRFLTKPCSHEVFSKALEAGIEQFRLTTAERELLSKTLSGSVSILTEVLSLVNPTAFGHAASVRRLVRQICQEMKVNNEWEIEIAAMLSQIGCVTIPETTIAKLSSGAEVSPEELRMYQEHPRVGYNLISKIPRLQGVADIIAYQQKHFDGTGIPNDEKHGEQIPFGARVLKLVIDAVRLISTNTNKEELWDIIHKREGWYDPSIVFALASVLNLEYVVKSVEIKQLEEDMILDEHVMTQSGDLLLSKGHEVTASLRERLTAIASTASGVREPIRVRCPTVHSRDKKTTVSEPDTAPNVKVNAT
ncbi:MAG: response regulator [Pirellulales bacterium]|nr:response regulator [Pirellulales bacterium]